MPTGTARSSIGGMDLQEIQHAIEGLPKDQQAALAAWIVERDQTEWKAEIERDFSLSGRGGALIKEMNADARAG
jgi:hypothetical protein